MPPKKTTRKKKTGTTRASGQSASCRIETGAGERFDVPMGKIMQEMAMRWANVVSTRRRWRGQKKVRTNLGDEARDDLVRLGLSTDDLRHLASEPLLQVVVPFSEEARGWEGRILPWEFLLAAATSAERGNRALTVLRHLDVGRATDDKAGERPVLVVQSAPGALGGMVNFDSERRIVESNVGTAKQVLEPLVNPTLEELTDTVAQHAPAVIHLMGFDAYQGAVLLEADPREITHDGYLLSDAQGQPENVSAQALAAALNAGSTPPALAYFNLYNSAARLAALAVAGGAGAAVGFQAEIDDSLAELFLSTFYRAWRLSSAATLPAFDHALDLLRRKPRLRGSGVVLWSSRSLLGKAEHRPARRRGRRDTQLAEKMQSEMAQPIRVEATRESSRRNALKKVLSVHVSAREHINYSILHNSGTIFDAFDLHLLERGTLEGVEIEVVLHVGSDRFPYRASFDIDNADEPSIKDRIKLPLTWDFIRFLKESVRTCIYVRVAQGGTVIYEDSIPATLDPVAEWIDNKTSGVWLPSFVLPRDEAVGRVVHSAQRYLYAIMDDIGAGFDGYQSVDPDAEDPAEFVDMQARAIWWALLKDYDIAYINPPPSYSIASQRIRKPGTVVDEQRGTCIDLAVAYAACLEFVEIYPVIFLLKGHAFPGYWRSEESYSRFLESRSSEAVAAGPRRAGQVGLRGAPWVIDATAFGEIRTLIDDQDLVPMEATGITRGVAFLDAYDEGLRNLEDEAEFDMMIDILIARDNDVTPLPL